MHYIYVYMMSYMAKDRKRKIERRKPDRLQDKNYVEKIYELEDNRMFKEGRNCQHIILIGIWHQTYGKGPLR